MPTVRMLQSVASREFSYQEDELVDVTGERAAELVKRGYGELVRDVAPVTPESRGARPETTARTSRRPTT